MTQAWRKDLHSLTETFPCALSKAIRPRLIFLPSWWPVRTGAWVYLNLVMIAPDTQRAPSNARQYTLAHEYGHIYMGHTALQFAYWLLLLTLLAGVLISSPLLVLAAFVGIVATSRRVLDQTLATSRELQADAVAVAAYGPTVALAGALWMARNVGSRNN